jgi:hypothetical protein
LAEASGAGVGFFSSLVIFTLRGEGRREGGRVERRKGGGNERREVIVREKRMEGRW